MAGPTQADMILAALRAGRALTPMDALDEFGCMRLGARIYDLRQAGHDITERMVETPSGKHVAEYRLTRPKATVPLTTAHGSYNTKLFSDGMAAIRRRARL